MTLPTRGADRSKPDNTWNESQPIAFKDKLGGHEVTIPFISEPYRTRLLQQSIKDDESHDATPQSEDIGEHLGYLFS